MIVPVFGEVNQVRISELEQGKRWISFINKETEVVSEFDIYTIAYP